MEDTEQTQSFSYLVGERLVNAYTDGYIYTATIREHELPEANRPLQDEDVQELIEQEVDEALRPVYKDRNSAWHDIKEDLTISVSDNRLRLAYMPEDVLDQYNATSVFLD